jgi:hypothetical protein
MGNVLSKEKREQVIALGRLGWSLRRIEQATGVRRETASDYLRSVGVALRTPGSWGHRGPAKPAIEVITDSGGPPPESISKPAIRVTTDSEGIPNARITGHPVGAGPGMHPRPRTSPSLHCEGCCARRGAWARCPTKLSKVSAISRGSAATGHARRSRSTLDVSRNSLPSPEEMRRFAAGEIWLFVAVPRW